MVANSVSRGAAPAAPGGHASNTPPATRRRGGQPPVEDDGGGLLLGRTYSGIDTLKVGCGIEWGPVFFASLAAALDKAKAAAVAREEADPEAEVVDRDPDRLWDDEVVIGDRVWRVMAKGARAGGDNGKGPVYRWRLQWQDCELLVMNRAAPSKETPNVFIKCGAMECLDQGDPFALLVHARDVCESLDGELLWSKLSRVDLFVDVEGLDVGVVVEAWLDGHQITRARSKHLWEPETGGAGSLHGSGHKWTGLTVGASPLKFNAYDKVRELKTQPLKQAAWSQKEWGGKAPKVCTRFEWQMGREALVTLGINVEEDPRPDVTATGLPSMDRRGQVKAYGTMRAAKPRRVADEFDRLGRQLGAILGYLSQRWIRFADRPVDRGNTQLEEDAMWWKAACRGLGKWAGYETPLDRQAIARCASASHLIRMASGCVERLAALRRAKVTSHAEIVAIFAAESALEYGGEGCPEHDFGEQVMVKMRELWGERATWRDPEDPEAVEARRQWSVGEVARRAAVRPVSDEQRQDRSERLAVLRRLDKERQEAVHGGG